MAVELLLADATYARLLAHVRANPDCDTARLVLADRLEELGEADAAAFVRLQLRLCEVRSLVDGNDWHGTAMCSGYCRLCPELEGLHERQTDLMAIHGRSWVPYGWLATANPYCLDGVRSGGICLFRRGLVAEVVCDFRSWLRRGPAVVRAGAVELVTPVSRDGVRPYFDPPSPGSPIPPAVEWDAVWYAGVRRVGCRSPWSVPEEIYEHLPRTRFPFSEFNDAITPEDAARAALSEACILWAWATAPTSAAA